METLNKAALDKDSKVNDNINGKKDEDGDAEEEEKIVVSNDKKPGDILSFIFLFFFFYDIYIYLFVHSFCFLLNY